MSGDHGEAAPPMGLDTRALRGALESRLFGEVAEATTVGRFEILHSLGRGGMGAVYAAHDPQLDRRVALKLLHNDRAGGDSGAGADLLSEARALARLNHINVVTIYETGIHEGALFLAMEFLDGGTLASWARTHPVRTRADAKATLRLYLRAGEGLVAAHNAGLVHRDFKPANVLLGEDGRLAVADFGLARGSSVTPEDLASFESDPSDQRMTTATIAGTPAYMSPEQFDGEVDARSDQFSFCVSLWEALFGRRPYEGKTPMALRGRMSDGEPSRVDESAPVPRTVERALRRGLSVDPSQRWPSMEPLLAALAYDPAARMRTGALVVAGAGALGLAAWQPWKEEASPCEGIQDALEVAWGSQRRDEVAEALTQSGSEFGRQTRARVEQALDEYATLWNQTWQESCEASLVRRERSPEAYDLTMQCLNARRDELDTVTSILATGDASVVERAVAAVAELSPVKPCTDLEALRDQAPEDPARVAVLAALEQERVRIRALKDTGQEPEAAEALEAAVAAAREVDDPRGLAHALELQGDTLELLGRSEEAAEALQESLRAAASVEDDAFAARVWPRLIRIAAKHEAPGSPGWRLGAETALLRAGNEPPDRAALHHAYGKVAGAASAFDEAEREHKAGLALRREHMADQPLQIADSLNMLAGVYYDRREVPEAESLVREVIATYTEALGSDHPNLGRLHYNLAGILMVGGKYAEAVEAYEESVRVYEQAYGPSSAQVSNSLLNLGATLARMGRFEEGLAITDRARATVIEQEGEDSPKLAVAYNTLGAVYDGLGRLEESLEAQEKTLALIEVGGPSADLAMGVSNVGLMQDAVGRHEEAIVSFERSIKMYEDVMGPDYPDLWRPLAMLARLYRKRGDVEKALPLAERAVRVLEGHEVQPIDIADASFELARLLRLAGLDEDRAIGLAIRSRDLWRGNDGEKEAAEIDAWLLGAER